MDDPSQQTSYTMAMPSLELPPPDSKSLGSSPEPMSICTSPERVLSPSPPPLDALTTTSAQALLQMSPAEMRSQYSLPGDASYIYVVKEPTSQFYIVLKVGVPTLGTLQALITARWVDILRTRVPNFKHHFVHMGLPRDLQDCDPVETFERRRRSCTIRPLKILPVPFYVRQYLTGNAWIEYSEHQTITGQSFPPGHEEYTKFDRPRVMPTTKLPGSDKDINITVLQAADIVGLRTAVRMAMLASNCFRAGSEVARSHGMILADARFDFAQDCSTGEIFIVDHVLTPESTTYLHQNYVQYGLFYKFQNHLHPDWKTKRPPERIVGERVRQDYELSRAGHAEIYQRIAGEPVETTVSRIMDQQYRQKELDEEHERHRGLVEEAHDYEEEDSNMTDVD